MSEAQHLRAQAQLRLQIARELSDRNAAENLRAEAARCHTEAAQIDGMDPSISPTSPVSSTSMSANGRPMQASAIAVIARNVRSLWLGSLAALKPQTNSAPTPQHASARATGPGAARRRYSLKYRNGTGTVQDMRELELSSDRAARREASRAAREMADNISWEASARGEGWTVLVINPLGQQICEVPVRFKKRWSWLR